MHAAKRRQFPETHLPGGVVSTFDQLLSGLKDVIASAIFAVSGPKSFSKTVAS
jgi:hypothetical protein